MARSNIQNTNIAGYANTTLANAFAIGVVLEDSSGNATADPNAAGGYQMYRKLATADTNAAVIKASAGRVYGYSISNQSAAAKFVKLYNKASAPTVGTDTPVRTIMIPAGAVSNYHINAGLSFPTGIAIAATGAITDADTTALAANDLAINVDYA